MKHRIELAYFGPIPLRDVRVDGEPTVNIFAMRPGELETRPYHDQGIHVKDPNGYEWLHAKQVESEYGDIASREILGNPKYSEFTAELNQNLLGALVSDGVLTLSVNHTNYGSLRALRTLLRQNQDYKGEGFWDEIYKIADQIAVLSVNGVIVTPDNQLAIARRANSESSETWHVYPAGNLSRGDTLSTTLSRETIKEAGRGIRYFDINFNVIGLVRDMTHSGNPSLVIPMRSILTDIPLDETLGEEHSELCYVKLDPDHLRKSLREKHSNMVGGGFASVILTGWHEFGEDYARSLIEEFRRPPYNADIRVRNPFE